MSYTKRQQEAIEKHGQHQLICAIPGSGKTHTSIGMVRHILKNHPDAQVLLVTFTNAAANEMRQRLEKTLARKKEQFAVSTFTRLMMRQARPVLKGRSVCLGQPYNMLLHRSLNECRVPHQSRELILSAHKEWGKELDCIEVPKAPLICADEVPKVPPLCADDLQSTPSLCN